jgi:hypothetical protein
MDPFMTPINANPRVSKIVLVSIVCGVVLTAGLTATGLNSGSRAQGCAFMWQACLTQTVIHTPDNPMHEGSPIDLFAFAFGIFLGVPIYSAVSYVGLRLATRRSDRQTP